MSQDEYRIEEFRIYAVAVIANRECADAEGDVSVWGVLPGIVFARSAAEACGQAYGKAIDEYPESAGYGHHQATALEVTADFLHLARTIHQPPDDDPRRGERDIAGEAVSIEEAIQTDTEASM